jgi:hypothetical protein
MAAIQNIPRRFILFHISGFPTVASPGSFLVSTELAHTITHPYSEKGLATSDLPVAASFRHFAATTEKMWISNFVLMYPRSVHIALL